jgi:hypothetical protein
MSHPVANPAMDEPKLVDQWSSNESRLSLSSSMSFEEEHLAVDLQPLKPKLEEPTWEIINKPMSKILNSALGEGTYRHPIMDMDYCELSTNYVHVEQALIESAAEVSIARQISISRSQRHLLRPITPRSERLVDRKPLTPTLVELPHRNSERIILEQA